MALWPAICGPKDFYQYCFIRAARGTKEMVEIFRTSSLFINISTSMIRQVCVTISSSFGDDSDKCELRLTCRGTNHPTSQSIMEHVITDIMNSQQLDKRFKCEALWLVFCFTCEPVACKHNMHKKLFLTETCRCLQRVYMGWITWWLSLIIAAESFHPRWLTNSLA